MQSRIAGQREREKAGSFTARGCIFKHARESKRTARRTSKQNVQRDPRRDRTTFRFAERFGGVDQLGFALDRLKISGETAGRALPGRVDKYFCRSHLLASKS